MQPPHNSMTSHSMHTTSFIGVTQPASPGTRSDCLTPVAVSGRSSPAISYRATVAQVLPSLLDVLLRLEPQFAAMLAQLAKEEGPQPPAARTWCLRPGLVFDEGRCALQFIAPGPPHSATLTAQERAVLSLLLTNAQCWLPLGVLIADLTAQGLLSEEALEPERSIRSVIYQLRLKTQDHLHRLIRLNRRVGYGIFPVSPKC